MYHCELCDYNTRIKTNFTDHIKTNKHTRANENLKLYKKLNVVKNQSFLMINNCDKINTINTIILEQFKSLEKYYVIDSVNTEDCVTNYQNEIMSIDEKFDYNVCPACSANSYDGNLIKKFFDTLVATKTHTADSHNINKIDFSNKLSEVSLMHLDEHYKICPMRQTHKILKQNNVEIVSSLLRYIGIINNNYYLLLKKCEELATINLKFDKHKLKKYDNQIKNLKQKMSDYEKQNFMQEQKISECENQILIQKEKISDYEHKISDYEHKISDYEHKISDYEHKMKLKKQKINMIKNRCNELKKENDEYKININHVLNKNANYNDNVKNYNNGTFNTINNNGTINITMYQYISEVSTKAPDINVVSAKETVDYYIQSKKNLLIDNVNKDVISNQKTNSQDIDYCTLRICTFKKHNPDICYLNIFCATNYFLEKSLIENYKKRANKKTNEGWFSEIIFEIITSYYEKNDNDKHSIWSTDKTRNSFMVKILEDNKSKIVIDNGGMKVNEYTIAQITKYLENKLKEYDQVIENCIQLTNQEFIKRTHQLAKKYVSEEITRSKKIINSTLKNKIIKETNQVIKNLFNVTECIKYNRRIIKSSDASSLNTSRENIINRYNDEINTINQIITIITNDILHKIIKKKLSNHYYISKDEMKYNIERHVNNKINNTLSVNNTISVINNAKNIKVNSYKEIFSSQNIEIEEIQHDTNSETIDTIKNDTIENKEMTTKLKTKKILKSNYSIESEQEQESESVQEQEENTTSSERRNIFHNILSNPLYVSESSSE